MLNVAACQSGTCCFRAMTLLTQDFVQINTVQTCDLQDSSWSYEHFYFYMHAFIAYMYMAKLYPMVLCLYMFSLVMMPLDTSMYIVLVFTLPTGKMAKYCDQLVLLSVRTSPEPRVIFTKFCVHVAYGGVSVLLRQGDKIARGGGSFADFLPHLQRTVVH